MSIKKVVLLSLILLPFSGSIFGQESLVTVSGKVISKKDQNPVPDVNIILTKDSAVVSGTVTDHEGRFILKEIKPGHYRLKITHTGFTPYEHQLYIGHKSDFINLGKVSLEEKSNKLDEVLISTREEEVNNQMGKKTFSIDKNISQSGGSILQAMKNLPGITTQDGKIKLRGSDKITVLIDGKQSAITGYDGQEGLDNIPASNIDKIEIINNPSSKYDASGSSGIINIKMKKNKKLGFNGKLGLSVGLGALWERKGNFPNVSPQYKQTPKTNPSVSLNYRKEKINVFAQMNDYYTKSLSSNEFTTRHYKDGEEVRQQLKRNKNTNYFNSKAGVDWFMDKHNTLTLSGSFTKKIKTNDGEQAFFNADLSQRKRLWKMFEDDHKTLASASVDYEHRFKESGHNLKLSFDYSFTRRNKDYDFNNILPDSKGTDAFKLLSDEHVYNFNIDYTKPLEYGKLETGLKLRYRYIPSNMDFSPGKNSVIDSTAGGWANYKELIPAVYANYSFETEKWEAELGARLEYMKINYEVNPEHPTYDSDGYHYFEPFINARLGYKFNENNTLSLFYNRRVDRPREKDLRIFPKYDDAEILKVGNPGLKPQFSNAFELGYKITWAKGYVYSALYHRHEKNTLARISTSLPDDDLIYAVFQNAGKSYYNGMEVVLSQDIAGWYSLNLNANIYHHKINAFTVENLYPVPQQYASDKKTNTSGDVKLNNNFNLPKKFEIQLTGIYLTPSLIPQGRRGHRFSLDLSVKKTIQKGQGELYFNATDLLNTMVAKKTVEGNGFNYTTKDYSETQVFRLGYNYKF